jgi:hypothetical protein
LRATSDEAQAPAQATRQDSEEAAASETISTMHEKRGVRK